jgi:hypothetical protein
LFALGCDWAAVSRSPTRGGIATSVAVLAERRIDAALVERIIETGAAPATKIIFRRRQENETNPTLTRCLRV